jgi:hypothetical protein
VWARRRRPNYKFYILAALLYVIIDIPWLLLNAQNANNMVTAIQGKPLQVIDSGLCIGHYLRRTESL